jgi:putative nucleotidyltransferase with HDIG domain
VAFLGVPIIAKGKVKGIIEIFTRTPLNLKPEWMEFINTLAGQAAIAIENSEIIDGLIHANQELTMAYDATIQGWSQALDLRDKETEGHTQRVAEWAVRFAQKLDIPDSDIMNVRRGALLHDIGKIGVPDNILLKPGPLSAEEWVTMRKHPETALSLLSNILYLKDAIDIPYCHHEKWDGSGYPRGLKGEEIPLVARLFSIIDVWDALSSDRPYRSAWKQDEIFEYIQKNSGTFFDPHLVPAFMELILEKSRKPKTYDSDNLG